MEIVFKGSAVGDSRNQPDDFPTVAPGKEILLEWKVKDAVSVKLAVLADGISVDEKVDLAASGSMTLPVQEGASYRLEAIDSIGAQLEQIVRVHVEEPDRVSPVASIGAQKLPLPWL